MNLRLELLACLCPLFLVPACDLPEEQIGNETETSSSSGGSDSSDPTGATDPSETSTSGASMSGSDTLPAECQDGDQTDADCNSCICENGQWSCTEIACPGSCEGPDCNPLDDCFANGADGGAEICFECDEPGRTSLAGNCHECTCGEDGFWTCEPAETADDPNSCNTCSCEPETGWSCTEIACPEDDTDPFDGPELASCGDEVAMDSVDITGVAIEADTMVVDVAYSGGCADHLLGGCWDGQFAESAPVQVAIAIAHDAMADPCEAYPSDQVTIDLTPLRESYVESYGGGGEISISIPGWDDAVSYSFE